MGNLGSSTGEFQQEIQTQIDRNWEHQQRQLQTRLDVLPLADAFHYLTAFHRENRFLEDDLSQVRYFSCGTHDNPWHFLAQVNPRRASRVAIGRTGLCALDVQNLRQQQRGLQHFYPFTLNGRTYNALTNPYPFAPSQISIASNEHESQGWQDHEPAEQREKIERMIEDLFTLAQRLLGWIVAYNGLGAGATIDHLHFHAFELPPGHGPFPMQTVAEQVQATSGPASQLRFGGDHSYPISAFRLSGSKENVVSEAFSLLEQLTNLNPASTVNLIATTEGGEVCLYVVPRNRLLESAAGFASRVGSMEVFGEFIYSTEEELQALQQGRINFRRLWNILKAISPPAVYS